MSINTIYVYIKGNKGYYGLHIENGNKLLCHECCEAMDHGVPIKQNCAEIRAACDALKRIGNSESISNCKIDIFSNLNLHDKFKSNRAAPDIMKPYISELNEEIKRIGNIINPLEPPTFHWQKKGECEKIDNLSSELEEFRKTHPH